MFKDLGFQAVTGALLTDGTLIVSGWQQTKRSSNPPVQAVLLRLEAATGAKVWGKAIPWGKAPGSLFQEGIPTFDGLVPREAGAFDAFLHAPTNTQPPNACRLVRVEAAGEITSVQVLDRFPEGCLPIVGPATLGAMAGQTMGAAKPGLLLAE